MIFFIDTANISEISELQKLNVINGVTTNPSLMAKEGIYGADNIKQHYINICELVKGPVSAEVISTDLKGMLEEAYELTELHSNIVVKIPMTENGIQAIHRLSAKGIQTNCTLVFSAGQALLAAKAGATYLSPFIGRLDDIGVDGLELIAQIRKIYDNYDFETKILAASIRNTEHLINCAQIGADVVTAPLKVYKDLFHHHLTDSGLKRFLSDHEKLNSNC